ncbi:MAG: hypothetical protein ACOYNC_00340 [Bacteroidales bacterium]
MEISPFLSLARYNFHAPKPAASANKTNMPASTVALPPGALLVVEPFSARGGGGAWARLVWVRVMQLRKMRGRRTLLKDFFIKFLIAFMDGSGYCW